MDDVYARLIAAAARADALQDGDEPLSEAEADALFDALAQRLAAPRPRKREDRAARQR